LNSSKFNLPQACGNAAEDAAATGGGDDDDNDKMTFIITNNFEINK